MVCDQMDELELLTPEDHNESTMVDSVVDQEIHEPLQQRLDHNLAEPQEVPS